VNIDKHGKLTQASGVNQTTTTSKTDATPKVIALLQEHTITSSFGTVLSTNASVALADERIEFFKKILSYSS
jgi:hypothetical protein